MLDAQVAETASRALSPVTFRSADLPPREALDGWRDRFGGLNDVTAPAETPFAARVDFWRLGRFVVSSNVSSPVRLRRSPSHVRRDGLDHWVLRVSRHGGVRSRAGDLTYSSGPRDVVLERLSGAYEDAWSEDEWVALIFAPDVFPEVDRALAPLGVGPVRGTRAALFSDFLLALDRRLPGLSTGDVGGVAGVLRTLVASLAPGDAEAAPRRATVARLRAERAIRANLASARLDSQRIAALSCVSRSTLYRLFEDVGGVAAHVRRLRLDAVHAALSDPDRRDRSIADIAAESGFHCVTSFNRAFKAHFGATPGEVRREESMTSAGAVQGDFLEALLSKPR